MKILVAIDFAENEKKVVDQGRRLAAAFSAMVTLLHVTEPEPEPGFIAYEPDPLMGGIESDPEVLRDSVAKRYQLERNRLQQISEEVRSGGVECVALLVPGENVEVILEEAEKHAVDMIVLGSHGKGMAAKLLLGSTSEGVVRKSTRPVHIVPTR